MIKFFAQKKFLIYLGSLGEKLPLNTRDYNPNCYIRP